MKWQIYMWFKNHIELFYEMTSILLYKITLTNVIRILVIFGGIANDDCAYRDTCYRSVVSPSAWTA